MSIQTNKLPDNPQIEVIKSGKTGLFTNYIYKAIPLAFDESMSYYETLCGLLDYLQNTIIPTVNNNADAVAELQSLYEQLRSYVDNYFTNLDVQEEINNKLDQMVADGTLPEIVASYLETKAIFGFDTVADLKNGTNLINGSYAKTLGFHELNDDGKSIYRIRTLTENDVINEMNIIAINNSSLVAELIENKKINVKQLGAYGDNTHDDTDILQFAINNYNEIYIPDGTYKISNELNIKSNIHLYGNGNSSIINMVYTYSDTIKYCLKFNDNELFLYRTIIEKLKFTSPSVTQYTGGIYISSALRGNVLNDLWFEQISNPVYLGNKIWALFSLNNLFATYFPGNTVIDETIPVGIYVDGNTIMAENIEICGKYKYGVYMNNATVSSFTKTNISGSGTTYMKNAYYIYNSKQINIDTCWIEQCYNGSSFQNTESINVINSNNVNINNIHLSAGSCYINNSTDVKINGVKYYTNSSGLRWLNGSEITCDKLSLGFCNFQNDRSLSMGHVNVIDVNNESNVNIYNDPLQLKGLSQMIAPTHSNVTITENTTDNITGDRCFTVATPTSGRGAYTTLENLTVGKKYTVLVYVKIIENCNYIYCNALNSTIIGDFPNNYIISKDTNDWQIMKFSFVATNTEHDFRILADLDENVTGTFLIDSLFLVEGLHNYDIPSGLTKKAIMDNSRLYRTIPPSAGNWKIGDIVYNKLTNPDYNNILYWVYDGTNWKAHNI